MSSRYNILLIISEDNGQHIGCYGDPYAQTPHIDKLASEGVRFENMYATQAVCSPGRASILTGLYPHQNGQFGLATHKYALYDEFPNMPRLLKNEGYRTGLIGKLHINPEDAFPYDMRWNPKEFISFANRDVRKMAEVAGQFMKPSDEPFFLQISFPDAHLPFHRQQFGVPEQPQEGKDVETLPFIGIDTPRLREETADYYNCMSRLDTGIGLVLEQLNALGKTENTLVIFTTDHGAQFSRGKTSIYEGGLRIPLIVRCPGIGLEGHTRDELVSQIDILPTITDILGIASPAVAGASFAPLLKGQKIDWRTHLYAEWGSGGVVTYFPQRSVRDMTDTNSSPTSSMTAQARARRDIRTETKNGHPARHTRKLPVQINVSGQRTNSTNNHPNTKSMTCKTIPGNLKTYPIIRHIETYCRH